MKNLVFIVSLVIGTSAFGQVTPKTAKSPTEFVPAGYVVFQQIQGDLNKDNQVDYVLIIKGTDKANFVKDEHRGELDRNPRGIIIALKNNRVLKNSSGLLYVVGQFLRLLLHIVVYRAFSTA